MTDALKQQVGGDHYKDLKIQPVEYIHANGLGYLEGNVVKYITRWRAKGGVDDLEKVKHYVDLLIHLEGLKPKDEGWMVNTGIYPDVLDTETKVEWESKEVKGTHKIRELRWSLLGQGSDITRWRLAK